MQQRSLIRTIYLYLFTIVGLALLVVGSVKFIDMALKAFIFTKADAPESVQRYYVPMAPVSIDKLNGAVQTETLKLSETEVQAVKSWLEEYKKWQTESSKIDYVESNRQRDAATNLALILVGLPLYLYHWITIKRETKDNLVVNPN